MSASMEEVTQVSPLKKIPSHCKRGLAARLAAKKEKASEENNSAEISEESAVYSTQVARMLMSKRLPDAAQLQSVISSDESDENEDIIPSKKSKSKKNSEKENKPIDSILLSDDEDGDVISCTPSEKLSAPADCVKSPSPPPPPEPPADIPVRPKRQVMKKAMKQLSDATTYLQTELSKLDNSCTDVDDVICLDDSLDEKSIFFFVQCNAKLQKHRLGEWEPFKKLMDTISEQQKISFGDIMLSLNDVIIRPSDTPNSVNLKSADTIVMYKNSGKIGEEDNSDLLGMKLFVQSRNSKKKLEFSIDPMAPLQLLINKYSIQTKTEPSHYRLQFDGEDVLPQDTPTDLELEDGFCLDIIETT